MAIPATIKLMAMATMCRMVVPVKGSAPPAVGATVTFR